MTSLRFDVGLCSTGIATEKSFQIKNLTHASISSDHRHHYHQSLKMKTGSQPETGPRPRGKQVKVHTLDIVPLRSESPPQKRSGIARVLKGFHSFTCTPTRSSAIGMSHTCLPSRSWYSFTDPGGMEG